VRTKLNNQIHRSQPRLEKLTVAQLVKKSPKFYGIRLTFTVIKTNLSNKQLKTCISIIYSTYYL